MSNTNIENEDYIEFRIPLSLSKQAILLVPKPISNEEYELISEQINNALKVIEKTNLETPTK